jgi:hypothetical protein
LAAAARWRSLAAAALRHGSRRCSGIEDADGPGDGDGAQGMAIGYDGRKCSFFSDSRCFASTTAAACGGGCCCVRCIMPHSCRRRLAFVRGDLTAPTAAFFIAHFQ